MIKIRGGLSDQVAVSAASGKAAPCLSKCRSSFSCSAITSPSQNKKWRSRSRATKNATPFAATQTFVPSTGEYKVGERFCQMTKLPQRNGKYLVCVAKLHYHKPIKSARKIIRQDSTVLANIKRHKTLRFAPFCYTISDKQERNGLNKEITAPKQRNGISSDKIF